MKQVGDFIFVDADEAQSELPSLLEEIGAGRQVRISRNGKTIAELRAPANRDRLQLYPDLMDVKFNSDPMEPLDAEEWPEDLR